MDDLFEAALALLKAMELRKKYMNLSKQAHASITTRFMTMARLGSRDQLDPRNDRKYYTAQTPRLGMYTLLQFQLSLCIRTMRTVEPVHLVQGR
ncbi:unnamed protein product [Dibothriocephalus latus]|uniref:Uncharacterized protein n=1 Tax=Dibothriocephalus latus TaxID=60516 RepID=A0A3P7LDD8_DIBLA|nr:unnamed protein product [Dibothriocephalus latus]